MLLKIQGDSFHVDHVKNYKDSSDFISRLFHLVSGETVNFNHKHISMAPKFSVSKAFTLKIISVQPLKIFFFENFLNL